MNAEDILDMIGDAKGSYIWDAQQIRSGGVAKKKIPVKKLWLIAAIIALMLMLVGCAVVYMLRMQDMKVGQYSFYVPTEYDEAGNVIPVETREPLTRLTLQGGANMEALKEWLAFTDTYDPDGAIMLEADSSGSEWDIADNYHLTYSCYTQEMVDKLDELVERYDLKLLSAYIACNYYESSVILGSLGLDGLVEAGSDAEVEYWDGHFHLEGTFDINLLITMDAGNWQWEQGTASYHYSRKDYFDPLTGFMYESHDYTQWDYTRKDGRTVLLVLNEGTARIYADLGDAFVTIDLDPVILVDGEEVPMTQEALEQFAELFDFSIQAQPTDMETVEKLQAEALVQYEAKQAEARANKEAQYLKGYEEFVQYRIESLPSPDSASYVLWDVNGDGIDELIINALDMLSMKDGESYKYFDLQNCGIGLPRFRPCEGNVFELWSEDFAAHQYYFYQANETSASFITGVIYDTNEETWYLSLTGGTYKENRQQITEEEAQAIINTYKTIDFDFLPLKKFGQDYTLPNYSDPYAQYIATSLDRYEAAADFEYTLLDIDGNGVEELIAKDDVHSRAGEKFYYMTIYTIRDGEMVTVAETITYLCEGGILESTEEHAPKVEGDEGEYYAYYRYDEDGAKLIEKIVRDRGTLYWGRVEAGKDGRTVTEEEAMSVIHSYRRMELDMKPFAEYPFE